jgi:hypothetical protein
MKWERLRRTMNVGRNSRRKPPRKSVTTPCFIRRREAERPPMISEFPPMVVRGGCDIPREVMPPGKSRRSFHAIGIWVEWGKRTNRPRSTCRRNPNRLRNITFHGISNTLNGRRDDPSRRGGYLHVKKTRGREVDPTSWMEKAPTQMTHVQTTKEP